MAAQPRSNPREVRSGELNVEKAKDDSTRAEQCAPAQSAAQFLPRRITLATMAGAAQHCRGCALYCHATQAVFGEGSAKSECMMIGEQPGDQEDLHGRPFVGPAGRLLNELLAEAGLDRAAIYLTNAVKHFKWTPRGKRRIHAKPTWREVTACKPWLVEEIRVVSPRVIVCLGATAAQSLMGNDFRLTQHRGEFFPQGGGEVIATVHPSALLRIPDAEARRAAKKEFLADLAAVAKKLGGASPLAGKK